MKAQSENWEAIALGHTKDVVSMAHDFILKLLELICHNDRVRDALTAILMDKVSQRYKKAIEHTKFLLYVERMGTPATLNHYFNENLEKWYVLTRKRR
jgi:hypothetical protein